MPPQANRRLLGLLGSLLPLCAAATATRFCNVEPTQPRRACRDIAWSYSHDASRTHDAPHYSSTTTTTPNHNTTTRCRQPLSISGSSAALPCFPVAHYSSHPPACPRHDTPRHDTHDTLRRCSSCPDPICACAGAIIIRRPSFGLQQRAETGSAWNGNPTLDYSTRLCIFFSPTGTSPTPTDLYFAPPSPPPPRRPPSFPQQPSLLSWVFRPCFVPCPLHLVYPQAVG